MDNPEKNYFTFLGIIIFAIFVLELLIFIFSKSVDGIFWDFSFTIATLVGLSLFYFTLKISEMFQ